VNNVKDGSFNTLGLRLDNLFLLII